MTKILVLLFTLPLVDFWVASNNAVYRLDGSGIVQASIPLPGVTCLSADGSALWLATGTAHNVFGYDSDGFRTCEISAAIPTALAGDSGEVWISRLDGNEAQAYACSGERVGSIAIGAGASDIQFVDDLLWVAKTGNNEVTAFSRDGVRVASIPTGQGTRRIAISGDRLFVSTLDDTIRVFSATSGVLLQRMAVAKHTDFAVTPEAVYVLRVNNAELWQYTLTGVLQRVIATPAVGTLLDVASDTASFPEECATAPGIPHIEACEAADLDGDGDVDQTDFGLWQQS